MRNQLKRPLLTSILLWLVVASILRVLLTIVANYPDYFPPNFNSIFLSGREHTFHGSYKFAFYLHIIVSPFILFNGLILLSDSVRRQYGGTHRWLGRVQVGTLLLLMLPSSVLMSFQAYGGWPAGLSFFLLSISTAVCAVVGVVYARRRRYQEHRRWMLRCFVLICSAVTLRLMSGTISLVGVSDPVTAYIAASWSSWLVPLAGFELFYRTNGLTPWSQPAGPAWQSRPPLEPPG